MIPVAKTPSETITEQKDEILNQIDSSSNKFVEQLQALCRQPSVSAQNQGLIETAELVSKLLKETGLIMEQFSPSKGTPIILAELASKTGRKTLVLCNHYDVQPVERIELLKIPALSATVEDGRI